MPSAAPPRWPTGVRARWIALALAGLALGGGFLPAQGAARPASPPPILLLRSTASTVSLGGSVSVTVRLIGRYDPSRYVQLLYAPAPFRHYRVAMQATPSTNGVATLTLGYNGEPFINRNLRLRARSGSSLSNTAELYVDPTFNLYGSREQSGTSPWLDFYATATVHPASRYPRPHVYFYRRYSRRTPYLLFRSQRMRVFQREGSETVLQAAFRSRDTRAPRVVFCLPRPIFADMGHPFFDASCGRRRLR